MARIRTIKPGFFRHEGLQELETLHPGNYCMLVFAGLFTAADRAGRFEWRPKQLKLDILPFIAFDMKQTLELLETFKFISKYEVNGKEYGLIPTFLEHQCPNVKEPQSRIPAPYEHSTGTMPKRGEGEREVEVEREQGKGNVGAPVLISNRPDTAMDVALFVKEGLGISGREHTWTVEEAVKLSMKSFDLPAMGAAAQIVTAWQEYEQADVEFRSGPANFLKNGLFLSKSRWRLRNGDNGKTSKFEQYRTLLETDAEVGGELAELDGGPGVSQGTSTGVPKII
jgi:hypothetical protein